MVGGASPAPHDVQATFCATLVDEWVRRGVGHAVVAPGSRSTPMAVAITDRPELAVHVVHDERVAGFTALGLGVDGGPALVLCTSGTAAANFFPAVVEAGLSHIPMLVLTADRPAELRGVGSPQTIDQIELYGRHVRWFTDAGVPDHGSRHGWRSLAAEAWGHAATGPAHVNLPFREPLLGTAGDLPEPKPGGTAAASTLQAVASGRTDPVPAGFDRQRGVILAGGSSGVGGGDVVALHERTGWPILADPLSGMRGRPGVVTTADSLLRHERFAADHAPEVVVRVGRPAASKVLAQWTARDDVLLIQVGGPGTIDPAHNVAAVCSIADLLDAAPVGASGTTWPARWNHAELRADDAIRETLSSFPSLTEPGAARIVAEHLPDGAVLTVASSMPVRDLEWFGGPGAVAHANRGANGIDGVLSTGLGRALAGRTSVVLLGDLAFVHDSNALVALTERTADLRVVVVDNDGGGIFSFLPQATELPPERYEQLFGTPLGTDVVALARAHGLAATTVTSADELIDHLGRPGPWVVRVPSNRPDNVEVHRALHDAVARALT